MCACICTEAAKQTMKSSGWQILGVLFLKVWEKPCNLISLLGGMGWKGKKKEGFPCILKYRKKPYKKTGLVAVSARVEALARASNHIQSYFTE